MTEQINAHIAPEPIEAPEPRPVEWQRDLVRQHALAWGWRVMTAEGPALSSMASFRAGVEAYEAYLECHDRRAR
jgi:hypothetical protein